MPKNFNHRIDDNIISLQHTANQPVAITNYSIGIDLLIAVGSALASYAVSEVLSEYSSMDPVDVSDQTLDQIAHMIRAIVEDNTRREYESLISASVDKFRIYKESSNPQNDIYLLQNIVVENLNSMAVLRDLGPGGILAWMMAVQNIMAAQLILDNPNNDSMKKTAAYYIPIAIKYLDEAILHNRNRVSDQCSECTKEIRNGAEYWECCYFMDGEKYCKEYRSKGRSRDRCHDAAREAQEQIVSQGDLLVFNPIKIIIGQWEEIANS
ncbi:hypothetical protein [Bacillus subtilis]|uniref:hypothetical protein n=1 Tax=Bacillus subtilis TaxID=1423 RepID=UPI0013BBB7C0|nr:hypothetical protein [Bacillus subtilis]KAF2421751.1 hypothetical protein B6K89_21425 [Bacillus subtilis]